jgi:hypothetical protein
MVHAYGLSYSRGGGRRITVQAQSRQKIGTIAEKLKAKRLGAWFK